MNAASCMHLPSLCTCAYGGISLNLFYLLPICEILLRTNTVSLRSCQNLASCFGFCNVYHKIATLEIQPEFAI